MDVPGTHTAGVQGTERGRRELASILGVPISDLGEQRVGFMVLQLEQFELQLQLPPPPSYAIQDKSLTNLSEPVSPPVKRGHSLGHCKD